MCMVRQDTVTVCAMVRKDTVTVCGVCYGVQVVPLSRLSADHAELEAADFVDAARLKNSDSKSFILLGTLHFVYSIIICFTASYYFFCSVMVLFSISNVFYVTLRRFVCSGVVLDNCCLPLDRNIQRRTIKL